MENVFTQSLSGAESFSAIIAMKPGIPEIVKTFSSYTSPPLYYIFEHLAFQTFGAREIVVRSLSVVFCLLTAIFIYKIGSLFFSIKTAVLATLLTILNPFFFTYCLEGRFYSSMAAGVAGSMFFFAKSFFGEGGKWTRVGFIVMTLWALYSHQLSIFAFLIQGLWLLYEISFGRRQTAIRIFKSYILIAILYLPWLYPLYVQTKIFTQNAAFNPPTLYNLIDLTYEYLAEGTKAWDYKFPYINTPLYSISLYIVFAVLILKKWWKSIKKTLFLILWFTGPIVLTWLISQKFQSIFYDSYLLYTIPGAMLMLASSRSKFSIIPLTILIILFGIIDFWYFTHPTKPPFRAYSETIKSELKPNDFLVSWNSDAGHLLWEGKFYGVTAPIYISKGSAKPFLIEPSDAVSEIPEGTKKVGVMTRGPREEVKIPGFKEEETKDMNGLKLIWLVKSE